MNRIKAFVRHLLESIFGRLFVKRSVFWLRYCEHHAKRSIAAFILKIGIFTPFFRYLASRINPENFNEFLDYKDNFQKFVAASIVTERIFHANEAFFLAQLKQLASDMGRPDFIKPLEEYDLSIQGRKK